MDHRKWHGNEARKQTYLLSFVCCYLLILSSLSIAGIGEYPSATNPDFTWLSTPSGLLRYDKRSDEWSFVSTHPLLRGSAINEIGIDEGFIWVATSKGIANAVIGSAEWETYTSSDGLPSDNISSVAFHTDYVWAGTTKGLARFDKYIEEWEPNRMSEFTSGITDIAVLGDSVWVVSPSGIFSVDVEANEIQHHSDEGDLLELGLVGNDIWFLGGGKALRYIPAQNLWRKYGTGQGFPVNPRDVRVEGEIIWIAGPEGIQSYDSKLDRWIEFLPLRSSPIGIDVESCAPGGGIFWVLTSRGVGRYDRTTGAWRRFSALDGLTVKDGLSIIADGNYVFVVGAESVGVYYRSRDSWRTFRYDSIEHPGGGAGKKLISIQSSGLTFAPSDLTRFSISGISSAGFRIKPEIENFDFWNSLSLHGELPSQRTMSGIYDDVRDRRFRLEYRGNRTDVVRGITVGEAQFRPFNSSLLDKEEVLGGGVKLSHGSSRSELWFAQRRGIPHVDFLRGKLGEREVFSYRLSHKEVIPYSEKLFVDGLLMQRNAHYFIDYTLGWIIFNAPDLVDPDSYIRVEYQYSDDAAEGRVSGVQFETQMGDGPHLGATILDFPVADASRSDASARYLAGNTFGWWENRWLIIQPEIAYARPDSHLAGAFQMELRSEKTGIKASLRRFSADFPSTIRRFTEFGRLTDEVSLEASIQPRSNSLFRFRATSGSSHTGKRNFAMLDLRLNPEELPSFLFSGRYDDLDTSAERDKRIGAKMGMGYDLPERLLKGLPLSELGFSSRLGVTRIASDDGTPQTEDLSALPNGDVFRHDVYWRIYAGLKAGASANIYQRFSRLPNYEARRTVVGVQMLAVPGIHSSFYLDVFNTQGDSGSSKRENLLSANLSVLPGNWTSALKWIDILSGYTMIERNDADRIRTVLVRPTATISQNLRLLANWIWNESEGTSVDSELLYAPDFGRIGMTVSARERKDQGGWEKGLMPWQEFLLLGAIHRLRLSLIQTSQGDLTWSPEHLMRYYMPLRRVLRSVYLTNSFAFLQGNTSHISESLLVELVTRFSLTFRLSGTITHNLNDDKTDILMLFRGYVQL